MNANASACASASAGDTNIGGIGVANAKSPITSDDLVDVLTLDHCTRTKDTLQALLSNLLKSKSS